jgi:hypothetical protein
VSLEHTLYLEYCLLSFEGNCQCRTPQVPTHCFIINSHSASYPPEPTPGTPPDWASKAPIKLCARTFAGVMEKPGQEVRAPLLRARVAAMHLQPPGPAGVLGCSVHTTIFAQVVYVVCVSNDCWSCLHHAAVPSHTIMKLMA